MLSSTHYFGHTAHGLLAAACTCSRESHIPFSESVLSRGGLLVVLLGARGRLVGRADFGVDASMLESVSGRNFVISLLSQL